MKDRWTWVAVLEDGVRVCEKEVGTFTAVDRDRCTCVELWPTWGLVKRPARMAIDLARGERAVFFRRRRRTVYLNGESSRQDGTVTVAGWTGPSGESYLVAQDDGRVSVMAGVETI